MTDVQIILRLAEIEKQARAEKLPTEQDCIRMMIDCRMRLLELGWRSGEYAPKDGTHFQGINAGFSGPSVCVWLGTSFFVADAHDWWPIPAPLVYRTFEDKEANEPPENRIYSVWRGDPLGGDYENVAFANLTEIEQRDVQDGRLQHITDPEQKATWPQDKHPTTGVDEFDHKKP